MASMLTNFHADIAYVYKKVHLLDGVLSSHCLVDQLTRGQVHYSGSSMNNLRMELDFEDEQGLYPFWSLMCDEC